MKTEEIAAIRARLLAATPGPWACHALLLEPAALAQLARDNDQAAVGLREDMPSGPRRAIALCGPLSDKLSRSTAAFIAAAPSDIAALLAHLEELHEVLAAYRENHALKQTLQALTQHQSDTQAAALRAQVAGLKQELAEQERAKLALVLELNAR